MLTRRCAVWLVAMGAVAGCSGGSEGGEASVDPVTTVATTTIPAEFTEIATTIAVRETFADGPLGDVCPATITVQIDDLPSVEHGPLFRLLGTDPSVDDAAQMVSGPLHRIDGAVEDVVLAIRAGGPAVEFRQPVDVMAADSSITIAEASTADALATATEFPTVAVVNLTDISHRMLMWDPATYPDVVTIDDLAATGAEILHLPGERFIAFLVDQGTLVADDLNDDFFGEPAAFVSAGGAIAQQGDALVEPFLFPALPQWAAPIDFALAADSGWASYDESLVVAREFATANRDCLGRLVPVIQEAIVSYSAEPGPTNQMMAAIRERFNPLTRAEPDLLDQGAAAATASGIFGGGGDGVVGSFDLDRVTTFAELLGADSTMVDDMTTNDFIDINLTL